METKMIEDVDTIQRIAQQYSIPPEGVLVVEKKTCSAGISVHVVHTTKGVGWEGCGQTCSVCKYQAASGLVGDDAVAAFVDTWLELFFAGENVPPYVTRCLTSDTFSQHYL